MTLEKNDNRVKKYGVIIGLVTAIAQHGIYLLSNELAKLIGITPFLPKIDIIDNAFTIVPIFILPYIWSYLYWAMAPMAASKCKFDHFLDYLASYLVACVAGSLVLIFAPTYMDRVAEGLVGELSGKGVLWDLMRFWYSLDGGERAYNLMPSFHCINSTISYLAVRKREEVPRWFRIYSLVITIIIYAATLFVKQHYILDVITGVAIAIIAFVVCKHWHWGRMFIKPINFFKKLFKKDIVNE